MDKHQLLNLFAMYPTRAMANCDLPYAVPMDMSVEMGLVSSYMVALDLMWVLTEKGEARIEHLLDVSLVDVWE